VQWPACACMDLEATRLLFTTLLPTVCTEGVDLFELYKHVFKIVNAVFGRISFDWVPPAQRTRSVSRMESLSGPTPTTAPSTGSCRQYRLTFLFCLRLCGWFMCLWREVYFEVPLPPPPPT
jgi:hypothetical protein